MSRIRIRIRIRQSKIRLDPDPHWNKCGSRTLVCSSFAFFSFQIVNSTYIRHFLTPRRHEQVRSRVVVHGTEVRYADGQDVRLRGAGPDLPCPQPRHPTAATQLCHAQEPSTLPHGHRCVPFIFFIILVECHSWFPQCFRSVEGLLWGAAQRFELGSAIQQADALFSEPRHTLPPSSPLG